MPRIPQARDFKRSTSPLSILVGYGNNMAVILAALEAYWENRANGQKVEEALLYTLWKECRKWLKKKEAKPVARQNTELFMRRKLNVELLRDASMEKLAEISPSVAGALGMFQNRKQGHGAFNMALQPLSHGYNNERAFYLQNNKKSGSSVSWSYAHANLDKNRSEGRNQIKDLRNKQLGDLTISDAIKLSKLFDETPPVVFRNKIDRMRNLVTINEGGLLGDLDGNLILMTEKYLGNYDFQMYAMDKYGNLFIETVGGRKDYVSYSSRDGYTVKQSDAFNHSSFMAGADVICAGCIHVGYDTRAGHEEAGVLTFIDNNSGHYKPTAQNLQNCVIALRDQGVNIDYVMVSDRSQGRGIAHSYWAPDFIAGMHNRWPEFNVPPAGTRDAPPVAL
jgi:hypothetical protein